MKKMIRRNDEAVDARNQKFLYYERDHQVHQKIFY